MPTRNTKVAVEVAEMEATVQVVEVSQSMVVQAMKQELVDTAVPVVARICIPKLQAYPVPA